MTCLRVRQLAIIDEVEVEFGPGLNVVTGETGAGKSIFVNAMKLVLGERGRPELVRSGAERAEVEAMFDVSGNRHVLARLESLNIECDGELVIRRLVDINGRSRAYLNGRLSTLGQLGAIARGLVDICSQHEHHTLVDPSNHLGYLDAFAGLDGERGQMGEAHAAVTRAAAVLASVEKALQEREAREDMLRFQLSEIDKLDPQPNEENTLSEELARLRHASDLAQGTREVEEALYSGDYAICSKLSHVVADLEGLCRFDPSLEAPLQQLDAARAELEDVSRQIRRYAERVRVDPERLSNAEERLHQLRRMLRKYGGTTAALLAQRDAFRVDMQALGGAEDERERLQAALATTRETALTLARALSASRRRFAQQLGSSITHELQSLGMGDARVEVEVDPHAQETLSPTGLDRVEFLIATNRGEEPRPLRKVASGGELSRALLALKRTLAGIGPASLYVFDEVDTGVGGAIAEVIAQKLREVSQHSQVLCITHLPQISVYGDMHYHVRKGVVEGRTRSGIYRLSDAERLEEIARMLGGIRISETTREAAAEMLREARLLNFSHNA